MQRALIVRVRIVCRERPIIGVVEAELESGGRIGGDLRADRAGEDRMEHERVGRDPADEPARQTQSWSRCRHPMLHDVSGESVAGTTGGTMQVIARRAREPPDIAPRCLSSGGWGAPEEIMQC